ncbi:MAG: hypothetical protein NVS3B7_08620 [Candidatus Elarobacter sp.]
MNEPPRFPPDSHPPAFPPHPGYAPTPPAAPPAHIPLEAVFSRAWALLRANVLIAVVPVACAMLLLAAIAPCIVIVFTFVVREATQPRFSSAFPTELFAWVGLGYLVGIVVGFCGIVIVFGLAGAAWTRGTATLSDGFAALRARAGATVLAGLALVAFLLALPTLFLSFLALVVGTMYVMPAVMWGRGGFAALGESFRLVRRSIGRSALGFLMLVAIQYALSFLAYPLLMPILIPLQSAAVTATATDPSALLRALPSVTVLVACGAGFVLVTLLSYAFYGYFALVLTGMYRSLVSPDDPGYPGPGGAEAVRVSGR